MLSHKHRREYSLAIEYRKYIMPWNIEKKGGGGSGVVNVKCMVVTQSQFLIFVEKSILYSKITPSQKSLFQNIQQTFPFRSSNNVTNTDWHIM